ncbi:hypothetical protein, unlikely [Trypanosoma brucei gambiense DAL972]|uniref:Uncharacterized protein n=1 Tax=Trypanosoma brucei gambiense (strain MHOM/CI/86/DAL972) TaxID=679716 RepID=C9ZPG5_TRYB9|nr:hypothetical protein, unlikely [Trypanosoma brucei gambiense DAL972]CBH11293.1 hypothetical protein, unlikely [Trypanosoma brucei gambiense DAL972]|eukprot:XP_011773580.1 hypothetical protein, unlikely [Trypanosoma brucei gambiense DAL972]
MRLARKLKLQPHTWVKSWHGSFTHTLVCACVRGGGAIPKSWRISQCTTADHRRGNPLRTSKYNVGNNNVDNGSVPHSDNSNKCIGESARSPLPQLIPPEEKNVERPHLRCIHINLNCHATNATKCNRTNLQGSVKVPFVYADC